MYSPYSNSSQRNKPRLNLLVFLVFLGLIVYWRYSSSSKSGKGKFESAGEEVDSAVERVKDKVNHAKHKVNDAVEGVKDKARKVADNVEHAAKDAKDKI